MHGIRVLDVGQMVAGPVAATLMADMGAEVIKIEPLGGDNLRYFAATWLLEARNKRSVTIDVRHERVRDLVRGLAATCDVVVENSVPGTTDRLGLGPDVCAANTPGWCTCGYLDTGRPGPTPSAARWTPRRWPSVG